MTGWRLRLKQAPALRVDLRGITPVVLVGLGVAEVEQLRVGYGMRRGSVVFAAGPDAARLAPTFLPAGAEAEVFWQLLARDLARHGGPFESLPRRRIERHLGDRGVGGKGELIVVR